VTTDGNLNMVIDDLPIHIIAPLKPPYLCICIPSSSHLLRRGFSIINMRMTRAALKAQASLDTLSIHEDASAERTRLSPYTDENDSHVLKEISNNKTTEPQSPALDLSAGSMTPKSNKKRSGTNDCGKKDPAVTSTAPEAELTIPNQFYEPPADAEDKHREVAVANTPEPPHAETVAVSDPNPGNLPEQGTLVIPEIREPSDDESTLRHAPISTPRFVPDIHASHMANDMAKDDSFVAAIRSRSPGKANTSIISDRTTSRSPQSTSRIEDSVDAIDALEDALEQFSGEMPMLDALRVDSPSKEPELLPENTTETRSADRASSVKKISPVRKPVPTSRTNNATAARIAAVNRRTTSNLSASAKTTTIQSVAKDSSVRTVGDRRPKPGKLEQGGTRHSGVVDRRVPSDSLSTSKPGFVPTKSTKPPTKSTFTLPGELYAAKMKAKREEKTKKEEEELSAQKPFKARPAPTTSSRPSVLPRENRASQARMSRILSDTDKENLRSKPTTSATAAPITRRPASVMLDVKKTRIEPNSSLRRSASVNPKTARDTSREPKFAANVPRVASLVKGSQSTKQIPQESVPAKKVTGKEAYERLTQKGLDTVKREKEEAARKARADAAERGRQASREWAEKQKARAAAQQASKKGTIVA
jgi:hypothetical protein